MSKRQPPGDVSIGKFDILATYTYAKGLLDGLEDDEAKERGMVAAIMGAKARLGYKSGTHCKASNYPQVARPIGQLVAPINSPRKRQ